MKRIIKTIAFLLLACMMIAVAPKEVRADDVSAVNSQLLTQINALRASKGLGALSVDPSLVNVASTRAQEACNTWSHTRPNGTQGIDMIPANKWRGENLSYVQYGSFTFTEGEQANAANLMFENLKASPTHYDNMVFGSFTKIGIATYVSQTASGTKLTTAYMFSN